MKALVGAFNQEKAIVGAFSVNVQPVVEPMELYTALVMIHPGYRAAIVPGRGGRVWGLLELQMKVRKVFTIVEMTTTR